MTDDVAKWQCVKFKMQQTAVKLSLEERHNSNL